MVRTLTILMACALITMSTGAQNKTKATTGTNVVVYVTSGKKYHTHKDCQYCKKSPNIKEISRQEAEKQGKELCKRCEAKDKNNKNK